VTVIEDVPDPAVLHARTVTMMSAHAPCLLVLLVRTVLQRRITLSKHLLAVFLGESRMLI